MTWLELLDKKFPSHSRVEALTKPTKAPFDSFGSSPPGISEGKNIGAPDRVMSYVEQACRDVPGITPAQFEALLSADDRAWISAGRYEVQELRCFAVSFADGIRTGRIRFDPDTGALLEHGIVDPQVAA